MDASLCDANDAVISLPCIICITPPGYDEKATHTPITHFVRRNNFSLAYRLALPNIEILHLVKLTTTCIVPVMGRERKRLGLVCQEFALPNSLAGNGGAILLEELSSVQV